MSNLKIYLIIILIKITATAHLLEAAVPQNVNFVHVDPNLLKTLTSSGPNKTQTCTIILSMKKDTREILDQVKNVQFSSRQERLQMVTTNLKNFAAESQKDVLSFLTQSSSSSSIRTKSVWITNQIIVWNADLTLVQDLAARMPQISVIHQERFFPLNFNPSDLIMMDKPRPKNIEEEPTYPWGINKIEAPSVWAEGNKGEGVLIATVGSGVRRTHETLIDNFVGDHGWFDPSGESMVPTDDVGQGTHATGLIVGSLRYIGVAPGAKWAACKGCLDFSCAESSLLACGQFIICPCDPQGHDEDCTKAPHLVSNGWGGGGSGDNWYDSVIQAWQAAGIVPLFSIGKSGPSCGSIGSPGDSSMVIGVGSTSQNDSVSDFSGAGSGSETRVKPDVVAPGEQIFSAYHTSDQSYASMTGTSLSSNYAAGVVALILSKRGDLSYPQVFEALTLGAVPTVPKNLSCGGIPDDHYPNNHAGYGRISARNSVDLVKF